MANVDDWVREALDNNERAISDALNARHWFVEHQDQVDSPAEVSDQIGRVVKALYRAKRDNRELMGLLVTGRR